MVDRPDAERAQTDPDAGQPVPDRSTGDLDAAEARGRAYWKNPENWDPTQYPGGFDGPLGGYLDGTLLTGLTDEGVDPTPEKGRVLDMVIRNALNRKLPGPGIEPSPARTHELERSLEARGNLGEAQQAPDEDS